MVASQIAAQFKQITAEMIKGYLEGPESPVKVEEMLEKCVQKVAAKNNITGNLSHPLQPMNFNST